MIDLSFNNLEGEIPLDGKIPDFLFLGQNKLNGSVPGKFLLETKNIDLSYNNFSFPANCQEKANINLYRGSSFKNNLSRLLPCSGKSSQCTQYYQQFHINCGGRDVHVRNGNGKLLYEGDEHAEGGAASNYFKAESWGFSSVGDYMDDRDRNSQYTLLNTSKLSMDYSDLYTTARKAPVSLTYYGYCLENGNYIVQLHFAEIQ
uniref:LRR-RLK n=3 Tax=Vernicia TaxID=73153 RepID=A0A140G4I3_9ROSI|nr:LRR-RLK [Vernicia montana]